MNIATTNRRYEVSTILSKAYGEQRYTLCWEDYQKLVWEMAEGLCKKAIGDGLVWTMSKGDKLFNMTLTSASDSFNFYNNF